MKVAVVAHADKTLGGGLPELRRALAAAGVEDPLWYEVPKAKKAPEQVERALDEGAELVFAWGGDGTVRRCVDVLAGTDGEARRRPRRARRTCSRPTSASRRTSSGRSPSAYAATAGALDVGRFGDERFAVMAGAGFDAAMIRDADGLKERIGRAAYLWSGSRNLRGDGFERRDRGRRRRLVRGQRDVHPARQPRRHLRRRRVFPDARPDDGMLELGVVTAEGLVAVDAHAGAHGGRRPQPVPVRAHHEGEDR